MPLEEASLSGKEKMDNTAAPGPMKADGTSSKGSHTWEYWKMARGSGKVTRKSCHLGSEGEKDSGFSDVSSEYLSTVEHTDSDDQPADSEHQPANSQKRAALQKASGGLTTEGAFPGLTPVYIVKNVLLKQPLGPSPTTQFLAWSSDQHPLSSTQGPPAQLFFLQPPVSSLKPLLPVQKPCPKETCLPLLSTYPKIAPHPGQEPQAKGAGVAVAGEVPVLAREGTTNKRFCLEETWTSLSELCPTPKSRDSREKEQGRDLPPLGLPSGQPASLLLDPETITQNAATASPCGPDPAVARLLSKASKKLNCGGGPGKQRRFHNTVEILRKSGLLDITLRTKELIRQNRNTQRDLSELQDHTQLFCEAVQNNDIQAWARLQQAMDRSATYWAAKGAGCFARLAGQPGLGVKPAGPAVEEEDATGDSLPCSPMNLPLTPITLVQVAMP